MLPTVNHTLYYQIASPNEEEASVLYKSRIADEDEQYYFIEYPLATETGKYKRLFLGDELSMYYLSPDGVKSFFESHVFGFDNDIIKLIKILKPDPAKITQVQRRSFLRVPADLDLAIQLPGLGRFVCATDDVGGGGISFLSPSQTIVPIGQILTCWLLLPFRNGTVEHAFFHAEVVHEQEKAGRMHIMIKYVDISEGDRQRIIRYCFERQLEVRNR